MIKHQEVAGEDREGRVGGLGGQREMAVAQGGPAMPPIELECPVVGCALGEEGGKYKTPPLPSGQALQLLTIHNQNHAQDQGAAV